MQTHGCHRGGAWLSAQSQVRDSFAAVTAPAPDMYSGKRAARLMPGTPSRPRVELNVSSSVWKSQALYLLA